jgi:hypothetical protein
MCNGRLFSFRFVDILAEYALFICSLCSRYMLIGGHVVCSLALRLSFFSSVCDGWCRMKYAFVWQETPRYGSTMVCYFCLPTGDAYHNYLPIVGVLEVLAVRSASLSLFEIGVTSCDRRICGPPHPSCSLQQLSHSIPYGFAGCTDLTVWGDLGLVPALIF